MPQTYKLTRPDSLVNDAWLESGNLDNLLITNPLLNRSPEDIENPGLLEMRLMRDPDYLSFAAKVLFDIDLLPFQSAVLYELWVRSFPMYIANRGAGKSFLLAVFTMLKCALVPNMKVVVVGGAFRQSKVIYEYCDNIWKNSPILRSVCNNDSGPRQAIDRCSVIVNNSSAVFIPLGNGSKIRGLRAQIIIADEFSSISPDIYETVVRGFAAVSSKPVDNVKIESRKSSLKNQGLWTEAEEGQFLKRRTNQCIIAGTADYDFMHFADYWKRYITYIRSKNDPNKPVKLPSGEVKYLKDYFGGKVDSSFDYKDYSIIRMPYELVPRGFMDSKVVASAKSGTNKGVYLKEYGAVFPADSDGFFKRSLIESCVATDVKPVQLPSGNIWFDAAITGIPGRAYIYGVDPAAESDNFTIVILEVHADHTRIVYGWSTNIQDFQKRKKAGMVSENDYYGFCARKIRDLMKVFPTENIAIDAQGGGRAVIESLQDNNKLRPGEMHLLPTSKILDPGRELETDSQSGLHIIHMCQFANFDFTSMANHGTRKDFEDKCLLFPRFDPVTLEISAHKDAEVAEKLGVNKLYDTLEDCVMEIEALKDELSTIVMSRTGTGAGARDRWDTPETKTSEGKRERLRKDRYSALIMANYIARSIQRAPQGVEYSVIGGFAKDIAAKNKDSSSNNKNKLYTGPDWFVNGNGQGGIIAHVPRRSV